MADAYPARLQPTRREYLGLLALIGTATLLRVAVLDARGLWFDEAFTVGVARLPLEQVWQLIARTDAHPPLYYLLLHLWLKFGDTPSVIRSLSALCGVLTVLVTWLFARELGGSLLAAAAGVLIAASALAIQASVEVRMYPLLALLSVTATWLLWRAVAGWARPWGWVLYGVIIAAALYVHYFAFLLLAAHALHMVLHHRRERSLTVPFLLAVASALLAYAPWWPVLAAQLAQGRANSVWSGRMPFTTPLNIVALSAFGGYLLGLGGYLLDTGGWSWGQLVIVLPFVILAAFGLVGLARRDAGRLLLAAWIVPVLILVAVSLLTGVYYAIPRYASFVQPFFVILLAQGVISLAVRYRRTASLVILTAGIAVLNLSVLSITLVDARYIPYDWADAAQHVQSHWQAGDAVIFYPHTARVAFGYYFAQPGATSVTLYPPPWGGKSTRAQFLRALPPLGLLVRDAPRVWLVLTDPTPAGSREALVEAVARSYRLTQAVDFRRVYVLLYVKR